jgi:hypothetical protein
LRPEGLVTGAQLRRLLGWNSTGPGEAALASEASGQRGDPIVRAHSASEDARERADDTRSEPGSSARAALASEASGQRGDSSEVRAIERNVAQVRNLSPQIPEEVALGYHFCFGTLGGWPRFQPKDLGQTVKLANAFVDASGRRVDWIHIPLLDTSDEAFFAPLKELKPRGARVYLGAIHNMERFQQRVAMARKYLPDFGLAGYCGFGRSPVSALPGILDEHLKAAQLAG